LEACKDGAAVPLGAPKQQVLLAQLAVNAGRPVGLDDLIGELWGGRQPGSAVAHVRGYAAAVRREFARVEPGVERIVRSGSGYLIKVSNGELDLAEFRRDVADGRAALAAGDLAAAATRLERARAHWRGDMLDGLALGAALSACCTAATQERAIAAETLADVYLRLGQPDRAASLMRFQLDEEALREQPYALLMRARYQLDGVAGALEVYDAARKVLSEELGVEPGEELQRLQRAVLNRDPELDAIRWNGSVRGGGRGVAPRELPAEAACFVGREQEAAQVRRALVPPDRDARRRPAVVVIYGPGGVGKSALAVRVGHDIADEFPDGQLYVDLYGSTPGLNALPTTEVVGNMLRSLGVHPEEIPAEQGPAAARFRSVTAEKRLLIVLDNAADAGQVARLVPATGTCAVLVTSRRPLSSLDADLRLRLTGLPPSDSLALLRQFSPVPPELGARIGELCGHLPLAVRIVAGRLSSRPDLPPDQFAERLADGRHRLDELELDEVGVRRSIRAGYEALTVASDKRSRLVARTFRVPALLRVPDLAPGVIAAMLGEGDIEPVRSALDHLINTQMLEPAPNGRYRFHDLVRLVATELVAENECGSDRDVAVHRAMAYYVGSVRRADAAVRRPRGDLYCVQRLPDDLPLPIFNGAAAGRTWIDAELQNIVAALEQAFETGEEPAVLTLGALDTVWHALHIRGQWHAAFRIGRLALDWAEEHGDTNAVGVVHLLVGRSRALYGEFEKAAGHLTQAQGLLRQVNNNLGVALALNALGLTAELRGAYEQALSYLNESLELATRYHLTPIVPPVLVNMSSCYAATGHLDEAQAAAERGLAMRREQGDVNGLGAALTNLTAIHCLRGDPQVALQFANEAFVSCREGGDRVRECEALIARSEACRRLGAQEALADAELAAELAGMNGDSYLQAAALRQRAKILAVAERWPEARVVHAAASDAYLRVGPRRDTLIELLLASDEPNRPWLEAPGGRSVH
jgi:DNA-binding SARP family transcriptional activator